MRGIWPIRFEDLIQKRIGLPIQFKIRFEQKNDLQVPSYIVVNFTNRAPLTMNN